MLCGLCRREDVDEVDVMLALGVRVLGVSAESRRRHMEAHWWAWVLDAPNAGRARLVVADLVRRLGSEGSSPLSVAALASLERIDRWLLPQHRELVARRRAALRGAGRLFRDVEVDPGELAIRVAVERVRRRVDAVEWCSCERGV